MIRTRETVAQTERAHRVAFLSRKPLSRTRAGNHGSFTFLGGEPQATFAHRRGTLPQVAFFGTGGREATPHWETEDTGSPGASGASGERRSPPPLGAWKHAPEQG